MTRNATINGKMTSKTIIYWKEVTIPTWLEFVLYVIHEKRNATSDVRYFVSKTNGSVYKVI